MWWRRTLELAGDLTAGDGLATMLDPAGHYRLWQRIVPWRWWRRSVQWLIDRPGLSRVVGALQIVLGGWLMRLAVRDRRG